MQVFGFGKKRPAVNHNPSNTSNEYSEAPSPDEAITGAPPALRGQSSSPALMRSPFPEPSIDSRGHGSTSVGSAALDLPSDITDIL